MTEAVEGRSDVVRAYIGLGSNVGDPAASLGAAVAALDGLDGVAVVAVSRLYATAPVGVVDQAEFRNAVVAIDVRAGADPEATALGLLVRLKELERSFGRGTGPRWGPRPLDLDILAVGAWRMAVERPPEARSDEATRSATGPRPASHLLRIPHAEAADRLFVLAPWADLAPDLVPPGWTESIAAAARRRAQVEGPTAVRVVGTWDADVGAWRPPPAGGATD
jgi:2-amino-4-hydroxy-6-hydroxymethyldihydropteridine diphosphokinase